MNIGILGSGDVAKTLGAGFLKHGHQIMMGTRTESKLAEFTVQHPQTRVGSFAEAAAFGEVIVLAVKGTVASEVLQTAGEPNIRGKTVIDTTNPIASAPPEDGVLKFFTSLDDSLMERLQREFSRAHFVKAFNSVGNRRMVDPAFADGKPTMFICGNDAHAKRVTSTVLIDFGWDVADMGTAAAARAIEPLCILWCIPGLLRNEWMHAFKLLKA